MRYPVSPLLWLWPPLWPFLAAITLFWALAHWAVWALGGIALAAALTATLAANPPAPAAASAGIDSATSAAVPYVLLAMLWTLALGDLALWVVWRILRARKRAAQASLWRQQQELHAWQWQQYQARLVAQPYGLAGPGMPPAP